MILYDHQSTGIQGIDKDSRHHFQLPIPDCFWHMLLYSSALQIITCRGRQGQMHVHVYIYIYIYTMYEYHHILYLQLRYAICTCIYTYSCLQGRDIRVGTIVVGNPWNVPGLADYENCSLFTTQIFHMNIYKPSEKQD